jgi:hypothetical protein
VSSISALWSTCGEPGAALVARSLAAEIDNPALAGLLETAERTALT